MAFSPSQPLPIFSDIAANLSQLRDQIFHMDAPVQMTFTEFNALWRYVDNMVKVTERAGLVLIEKSATEGHSHDHSTLEFNAPEVNETLQNAQNGNLKALEIAGVDKLTVKAVYNGSKHGVWPML
ncbi:hypothetical protein TSTA_126210 [Talaromyces stipitatus ATCC 10500]|uniref:Uncharacterized protein n=1 Tax=Talaromyces stipitatus (strain ATCC 10500 / CBS 375.48 / QM 6759 / NRRL 1006) TaxID=441959 RepID=B8MBC3_TALSN|nr:uncharacterized protein TSTA_126210 [Talaromyces stipitatus ATCC 10500]EED18912.1 hypothetical protein TSTA_126210 [Talaromyces stipitatus ATCC 10500]